MTGAALQSNGVVGGTSSVGGAPSQSVGPGSPSDCTPGGYPTPQSGEGAAQFADVEASKGSSNPGGQAQPPGQEYYRYHGETEGQQLLTNGNTMVGPNNPPQQMPNNPSSAQGGPPYHQQPLLMQNTPAPNRLLQFGQTPAPAAGGAGTSHSLTPPYLQFQPGFGRMFTPHIHAAPPDNQQYAAVPPPSNMSALPIPPPQHPQGGGGGPAVAQQTQLGGNTLPPSSTGLLIAPSATAVPHPPAPPLQTTALTTSPLQTTLEEGMWCVREETCYLCRNGTREH